MCFYVSLSALEVQLEQYELFDQKKMYLSINARQVEVTSHLTQVIPQCCHVEGFRAVI
jgi:hypothetical protein